MGFRVPSSPLASKWLGFVTAVWVQAISGNNYTFANYSDALKSLMGLTQLQLNNLSVAKDVGKAFGLFAGFAFDRFPTPLILLIGSIEGLIGYGVQWLVVSERIRTLPYWQMCIFLCMGGNSTTWMNTAVLVTCMRNFRKNRGPVSGILKGYIGLSTAIFTDFCSALFSDNPSAFLLMLAIVPAVVCLASMVFLREVDAEATNAREEKQESHYFIVFNSVAIVVALLLLLFDFAGEHPKAWVSRIFVAVLLFFLASPLVVPVHAVIMSYRVQETCTDLMESAEEPLLKQVIEKSSLEVQSRKKPAIGEDHTICEAACSLDFWVLFVSFLCGVGTGLAVMNNMAQIGVALGYNDVSVFVSLTSIWGFFGRIGSGSLSEYFIKKAATPRPLWNAASQVLMGVGYLVMALGLPGSLYVGSIVVGVCYGVRIAVSVPTASELFGLRYYGLIYNVLTLNLPLGSFLFSGLLAGLLYDAQATPTASGGNTCIGAHCYRLIFLVMAAACLIGFGLDIYLAIRTKKLYLRVRSSKKLASEAVHA